MSAFRPPIFDKVASSCGESTTTSMLSREVPSGRCLIPKLVTCPHSEPSLADNPVTLGHRGRLGIRRMHNAQVAGEHLSDVSRRRGDVAGGADHDDLTGVGQAAEIITYRSLNA